MDFEENKQPTPSEQEPANSDAEGDTGESFLEMLEASFDYEPPRRANSRYDHPAD